MTDLWYLDASAWAKRYFAEQGIAFMHELFESDQPLVGTILGYIEVAGAIARKGRKENVSDSRFRLERDWQTMLQFDLTRPMLAQAVQLAWTQKLRGADAIHLASAQAIQADFGQRSLSAFNRR